MKEIEELKSYWKTQGLRVACGAELSTLLILEKKLGGMLPLDFRAYLLAVDGMLQEGGQDCDQNGFSFWPLSRIKSIPEECEHSGIRIPRIENVSKYLVFADYMQWSWAYAISAAEENNGRVITVGTVAPRIVAGSFTSFVDIYLKDASGLYH